LRILLHLIESRYLKVYLQLRKQAATDREKVMDRLENSLSMEQELSHRIFSDNVQQLSQSEAQELLVEMHKQMMYRENIYKKMFVDQQRDIVDSLFGVGK
jgi:Phycobilisome degradation protein nblA